MDGRCRPKLWPVAKKLPPRHLEPVLQALVRDGILKGMRGPHGGYELAREKKRISAEDILRAAGSAEEAGEPPLPASALVNAVVRPALAEASALSRRRLAGSISKT
jgi:Rrf2 family iron-sulfur cluster assembly transcriptional regulator